MHFGSRIQSVEEWSSRRTSRASQLSTARSLRMSESLAPETVQRIRYIGTDFTIYVTGFYCSLQFWAIEQDQFGRVTLGSATSSGLGRAPRSAMQDPIQAPPGTTRQAGLYTS
ncbi:hypothetical protein TNCV_3922781 [Trichonephila clavipes]|nr:hypothetical protein TNCV_3922781 [Trichonephila clavipes]